MAELYPPSDYKLKKLRERGVLPYSQELIVVGVIVGFGGGLYLLLMHVAPFVARFSQGWPVVDSLAMLKQYALNELFYPLCLGVVGALVGALICGFMQTRFYFSFSTEDEVVPRVRQLARCVKGMFVALALLLYFVLSVGALGESSALIFERISQDDFWTSYQKDSPQVVMDTLQLVGGPIRDFCIFLVLVVATVGVTSRFVTVFAFRWKHRMSRAEMEAEYLETELSPQMKQAIQLLGRADEPR